MERKRRFTSFTLFSSIMAALGGLLFGYNTSVISGAILFISKDFQLTTFQEEIVVSTVLIGAVAGAFAGGFLADSFGRKKTLFGTIVLFFVGILLMSDARSFEFLIWGRFVTGLGIGMVSMAAPLYIAEMSPTDARGPLVSLYQLAITVGILVAYIVSYYFAEMQEWRQAFSFAFIPLAIQFIGLFFIPETPSWLMSRDRKNAAETVLKKIYPEESGERLLRHAEKSDDVHSKKGWRELFTPALKRAFLVGVGASVFQQITGINTVIYYAPQIFQKAGYQAAEMAIFATMLVGIVNVFMTVVALWVIDRLGRKPILIGGLIGMTASLAVLGGTFVTGGAHLGIVAVVGLMVYVACFAISWGPVTWLIISEIFPLGVRGRAVGIAVFANWVANYFVSLTFLTLIDALGTGMTFWLYTAICLLGLWFVIRMVPETKGKTFEEIQNFWHK